MPPSMYPTRRLGANGPEVSAVGFGAMGMSAYYGKGIDKEQAFELLTYAADRGVTFWDTASVYGSSEATLGEWFTATGRRSDIFLATKIGKPNYKPGDPMVLSGSSRPEAIKKSLEHSLKLLQTSWIDLYYQHRVDPDTPIEVVMEALRPYVEDGTIRYIGLSECSVDVLRRAKAVKGVGDKLIACQMELNPFELEIVKSGFVDVARELGVGIVAYSPLGRGMITGRYRSKADFDANDTRTILPRFSDDNFNKNLELVDKFGTIAGKYGATTGQIALAWILAAYPDFVPIPGSSSVARLEENAKAAQIPLGLEDVHALNDAVETADIQGARYPPGYEQMFIQDCISLEQWQKST
ncbi:Aldo/keto reductase [Daedalea quercina L-15889]|uniref:Aldo/keto reductase n=1 Tax=Daedalea quercina L-15889 TaxID=1314783 RepID=A0A165QQG3_9APHY|nr:Aldo/keto reductase [Daedalea quercina L-15889]